MHIDHIAIWTHDVDRLAAFYAAHFGATVGPLYVNAARGFQSRFLSLDQGPRIEVMDIASLADRPASSGQPVPGYAHLAIAVGSPARVDALTAALAAAGVPVVDGPRLTGDGYHESVVRDPDGNFLEITA